MVVVYNEAHKHCQFMSVHYQLPSQPAPERSHLPHYRYPDVEYHLRHPPADRLGIRSDGDKASLCTDIISKLKANKGTLLAPTSPTLRNAGSSQSDKTIPFSPAGSPLIAWLNKKARSNKMTS